MVSIVIPIYNKEKELKKCISSLINQTYKDLEIILVNDGSKDFSRNICENFLNQDSRIKLINKENQGVELARMTGIENATGEYITFVDSDDWLPNNAIEDLLNAIKRENADVSFGKYYRVLDKYSLLKRIPNDSVYNNVIITKNEFINEYYDSFFGSGKMPINMWAKLYKKSLINSSDVQHVGISHGEDLCFNLQVLPNAKKIVSIPKCVYFYRWGGMTNKINKNLFKDACKAYKFKLKMIEKNDCKECYQNAAFELCNFFITYIDTYLMFANLNDVEMKDFVKNEIQNKILQNAVRIPTYEWFLNNQIYQCIKEKDIDTFLNMRKKGIKKKKIKNKILRLISNIIN